VVLANVGVPMIALEWPFMFATLIPVIVVEALVLRKHLGLGTGTSFKLSSYANIVSTVIGVPLSWLAMLIVSLVTTGGGALGLSSPLRVVATAVLQAAWLPPYEAHLLWLIPVAAMVLLIPAFLASVLVERLVLARLQSGIARVEISRACWRANEVSYLLLLPCAAGYFTWWLSHGQPAT
jgi:hypothetical protein